MKLFYILLLPIFLHANLLYNTNHDRELALLESFDINPLFLYDSNMDDILVKNSSQEEKLYFFKALDRAYVYIPAIKNILSSYHIPQEFLYLAMVESNFSSKAFSKTKAAGLWQFMPQTAADYGLRIDSYVDERNDIIKSTKAASRLLSKLHKRFGKWYLAAIAYNCGASRLELAIKKAKSDELSVLLDENKKYLPAESRKYIRKIVAMVLIGHNEKLFLNTKYEHLLNIASTYSVSTVTLPGSETLQRLSRIIDIPLNELRNLNRHLKYDIVPPYMKRYEVYIPYKKLSVFKQKYFAKRTSKREVYARN